MKSVHNLDQQENNSQEIKRDGIFRKSSLSGANGCVAIAKFTDGSVKVRDTKNETSEELSFDREEWEAFLKGVHNHEFDI